MVFSDKNMFEWPGSRARPTADTGMHSHTIYSITFEYVSKIDEEVARRRYFRMLCNAF